MNRNNTSIASLILRLSIGVMMLLHGIAKLDNGISGIKNKFASSGMPEFFAYTVYIGEVIAPIMLIIGFRTKIASLLVAFTMLVAVILAHSSDVFMLGKSGGWSIELQGLYFFASIALFFIGGGKYSLSSNKKWD